MGEVSTLFKLQLDIYKHLLARARYTCARPLRRRVVVSIDDGETWEAVHAVEDSAVTGGGGGRGAGRSVSVGARDAHSHSPHSHIYKPPSLAACFKGASHQQLTTCVNHVCIPPLKPPPYVEH